MTGNKNEEMAARFEENRERLRATAYRMLGSLSEADDAVQEAWLRLHRTNTSDIENVGGWLTTVVARVCLDMLRQRKRRREEPRGAHVSEPISSRAEGGNPETEVLLADAVGLALLVVLQTLAPAERVAFVLHDTFGVSFDEIAPIVNRTPAAARQLASRARRRVRGASAISDANLSRQREVVEAFLAAARNGDFHALLAVLNTEVVFRADPAAVRAGGPEEVRGAEAVANLFVGRAQAARPVLINGRVGIVVAPQGQLLLVLLPTIKDGQIIQMEAVADPVRLQQLNLSVLDTR